MSCTHAKPFNFTTQSNRRRARSAEPNLDRVRELNSNNKGKVTKSKPAPHLGVPIVLPNALLKRTQMQPFSFDSRDSDMVRRRGQKLQLILQEEKMKREFKANPIPSCNTTGIPKKEPAMPTAPKPFHLEVSTVKPLRIVFKHFTFRLRNVLHPV
jgi:hypothetical protein